MIPLAIAMKKGWVVWNVVIASSASIQSKEIDGQIVAVRSATKNIFICRLHDELTAILKQNIFVG
jgi:hypothetical protein